MTNHVLVTGGAGYLGFMLCENPLGVCYRVTVIDTLMYGEQSLLHV